MSIVPVYTTLSKARLECSALVAWIAVLLLCNNNLYYILILVHVLCNSRCVTYVCTCFIQWMNAAWSVEGTITWIAQGFSIYQNIYMHACELLHDDRSHNYTLTYVIHTYTYYIHMYVCNTLVCSFYTSVNSMCDWSALDSSSHFLSTVCIKREQKHWNNTKIWRCNYWI